MANQVADALSRQTELGKTRDALREMKKRETLGAVWRTDDALLGRMALIRGYANDEFAQGIRQRLGNTEDALTVGSRQYKICRGLLYSRPQTSSADASNTGWKLYVPVGLSRTRVLYAYHDSKEGGHKGFQKTYQLCARFTWWRGMGLDVRDYVLSCPVCQRGKTDHQCLAGTLQPLQFPKQKWKDISVDFVTGLPVTDRHFDAIMTVIDRCTKMVHLIPMKTTDWAQEMTNHFMR